MSSLATGVRYGKGLAAASAVAFGTVGTILLVEVVSSVPDNLSFIVLPLGIIATLYVAWTASRPKSPAAEPVSEVP